MILKITFIFAYLCLGPLGALIRFRFHLHCSSPTQLCWLWQIIPKGFVFIFFYSKLRRGSTRRTLAQKEDKEDGAHESAKKIKNLKKRKKKRGK